jgi:hypothetical protein
MDVKGLLIFIIAALPAFAAQPKCKENPKVIAACYSVHGRVSMGADTVRLWLWPVGTKRMLGVTSGPNLDDDPIFPTNLNFDSSNHDIYGDFEVCPFTPEHKGAMRLVCIESASHLVVRHESSSK